MSHTSNPQRQSVRLKGYDYSQPGGYFVTICTRDRTLFFEDNSIQKTVEACWLGIPDHFPNVELDQWIIMPNHLHGIILFHDSRRGEAFAGNPDHLKITTANASPVHLPRGTMRSSLSAIMQNFKSISTRRINQLQGTTGKFLWQRGYYDRIIRNEKELNRIRRYIEENPLKWELDPYHPARHR